MKKSKLKIDPLKEGEKYYNVVYVFQNEDFVTTLSCTNEEQALIKFKELYSEKCEMKFVKEDV